MKFLPLIFAAVFLAACASAAPVIVSADQPRPVMAETDFPINCMQMRTFDEVTGQRTRIMQFNDTTIDDLDVVVHVDRFRDVDDVNVIVVYHTFPQNTGLICVLHATPEDGAQYFLEDLV